MKILKVLLVGTVIVLASCAVINVKTKDWSMSAASVFKQIEIPNVDIGEKGDVHVVGYKGMVAGEAIGQATKAAIAIK